MKGGRSRNLDATSARPSGRIATVTERRRGSITNSKRARNDTDRVLDRIKGYVTKPRETGLELEASRPAASRVPAGMAQLSDSDWLVSDIPPLRTPTRTNPPCRRHLCYSTHFGPAAIYHPSLDTQIQPTSFSNSTSDLPCHRITTIHCSSPQYLYLPRSRPPRQP